MPTEYIMTALSKERILKAAREKQFVTRKGVLIRLSKAFSETLQARREWDDIGKELKNSFIL